MLADRKALLGLELGEDAGGEKRAFMAQTPIALAEAITGLVESGNTNDQARGVTLQAWRDADEPAREAMYGEYIGAFLTQKLTPLARLGTGRQQKGQLSPSISDHCQYRY